MSRITAPVAKLSRALSSSSAARAANPLLDAATYSNSAGAVLMPKYAELLRNRRSTTIELSESTRSLTTTHRPTPQPSIANRPKPLMQTFSTSTSTSTSSKPSAHLDAAILPSFSSASSSSSSSSTPSFADLPRMPLLPDNYAAAHPAPAADPPVSIASSSIVAINPDAVVPATPLSSLSGVLDTVELKFVHEEPAKSVEAEESQGMIRDLWKGLVEDVLGGARQVLRKST